MSANFSHLFANSILIYLRFYTRNKSAYLNRQGIQGNSTWDNNKNQLPTKDSQGNPITYQEYDVNPTPPKKIKGTGYFNEIEK